MKRKILISVIDGHGGGIGKQIIEQLSPHISSDDRIILRALGTNALATNAMLKAGANDGATGENAIVINARKSDIIVGVMPIIMPNSILGEITPAMAEAIGSSDAVRILIPLPRCNTIVAIPHAVTLSQCLEKAIQLIRDQLKLLEAED